MQIGAHVLGQHRYRAPGDDGKSGHVQDRLDDDLDMEVRQALLNPFGSIAWTTPAVVQLCSRAAAVTLFACSLGWSSPCCGNRVPARLVRHGSGCPAQLRSPMEFFNAQDPRCSSWHRKPGPDKW